MSRNLSRPDPLHLMSVADAALSIECSERTIRRAIADGRLTSYRMGRNMVRVDPAELRALLMRGGGPDVR